MYLIVFYTISSCSHILKYWVTLQCQNAYRLEYNIWRWAALIEVHLNKTYQSLTR